MGRGVDVQPRLGVKPFWGPVRYLSFVLLIQLTSLPALAESTFDALDAALEAQFTDLDAELEAQYQALDEALEASFQKLKEDVEKKWGKDDAALPGKHQWVDYSVDKALRRKIDFESGLVEIEHIIEAGQSVDDVIAPLQAASSNLATASIGDLAAQDEAINNARAQLQADDIELTPMIAAPDNRPVLGSSGHEVPAAAELATLVKAATASGAAQSGDVKASVRQLPGNRQKVSVKIPLRLGFKSSLAGRYREAVLVEAKRRNLQASLVYAVMETESSFNPRARSPIPAFGLMQLVPRSGAMDAYQHVYGEKTLLDPEYLFDPEQNVELGAAYLEVLFTRYLRHITNLESRRYCMIAAYNTGAGNVARSFVGNNSVVQAAEQINQMTPQQVYDYLLENLPYEETRNYLKKVTKAQKKYASLDKPIDGVRRT